MIKNFYPSLLVINEESRKIKEGLPQFCESGMFSPDPGPEFFNPAAWIHGQKVPGSGFSTKFFSIIKTDNCY
jgi:hypothetical protein